jgi:6-phosphogluconolactonase
MAELHILPSTEETAQAKAKFVATLAEECLGTQGKFTIALSGGSTPRRLYQILASPPHAETIAWDRWHIFWSDERCVPPDHQDSNFRMARQALLDHVPVPPAQVYRMRGEVAPEKAAREYETAVLNVFQTPVPSFDLILLGIGDDGHTASLFPGSEALLENQRLVMANLAPSPPVHRITFTLPLINAAKVVAFLDTDESKAEVLRRVLEPAPGEDVLPAARVRPTKGIVHWFLTKEAASLLRTTDA